jgi:hypothetical protein
MRTVSEMKAQIERERIAKESAVAKAASTNAAKERAAKYLANAKPSTETKVTKPTANLGATTRVKTVEISKESSRTSVQLARSSGIVSKTLASQEKEKLTTSAAVKPPVSKVVTKTETTRKVESVKTSLSYRTTNGSEIKVSVADSEYYNVQFSASTSVLTVRRDMLKVLLGEEGTVNLEKSLREIEAENKQRFATIDAQDAINKRAGKRFTPHAEKRAALQKEQARMRATEQTLGNDSSDSEDETRVKPSSSSSSTKKTW